MIGKWPCQQPLGGKHPWVNQAIDERGYCCHEECNPENNDRVKDEKD
jgi:hypothetical protein